MNEYFMEIESGLVEKSKSKSKSKLHTGQGQVKGYLNCSRGRWHPALPNPIPAKHDAKSISDLAFISSASDVALW
jgi:hypothetical protein